MKVEKIKREINNKGVTLISLIITVIVMAIISSIAIISGMETADSIEIRKFNTELQLIQARVDTLYSQLKSGEKTESDLGGEDRQAIIDRTLNKVTHKVGVSSDFRYYTNKTLEKYLGIEDITQSVLINWKTREVISVEGIKIDGVRYYTYEGNYKPSYTEATPKDITVTASSEVNGDIKKVTVTVVEISDNAPVSDFTLKYKLEGDTIWKIADYNYFETATSGKYLIEVSGNGINTGTTDITLEE